MSGWPDAVRLEVVAANATLEGERATSYRGPGQGFSGLTLVGTVGAVYDLTVRASLTTQPELPVLVADTSVAVALCDTMESYDAVLSRCTCITGSERSPKGKCRCSAGFHASSMRAGEPMLL